jgi:cell division protein YceG involved in septum cleavage
VALGATSGPPAGPEGAPVEFTIQSGAATSEIAADLAARTSSAIPRSFASGSAATAVATSSRHLRHAQAHGLRRRVAVLRGPARAVTEFRVTVPPGSRSRRSRASCWPAPTIQRARARSGVGQSRRRVEVGAADRTNREGIFFPDTYNLDERTRQTSWRCWCVCATRPRRSRPNSTSRPRAAALGVSPWDVLVVALVGRARGQGRSRPSEDRPRDLQPLQRDMKLEIDATVLYAVNKDRGLTRPISTSTVPTTLQSEGLPPTPIARRVASRSKPR